MTKQKIYAEIYTYNKRVKIPKQRPRTLRGLFRPSLTVYHERYKVQITSDTDILFAESYSTRQEATEALNKILEPLKNYVIVNP